MNWIIYFSFGLLAFGGCCLSYPMTVRMEEGPTPASGAVYFSPGRTKWEPVCDELIGPYEAAELCGELGFPKTTIDLNSNRYFNSNDDVKCNGSIWLIFCFIQLHSNGYVCKFKEQLGISCNSRIRFVENMPILAAQTYNLVARPSPMPEGILQVYVDGAWSVPCAAMSDFRVADVVCKEFGFQSGDHALLMSTLKVEDDLYKRFRPVSLRCLGNETSVDDCELQENHDTMCNLTKALYIMCNETLNWIPSLEPIYNESERTNTYSVEIYDYWGWIKWVVEESQMETTVEELNKIAGVICTQNGLERQNASVVFRDVIQIHNDSQGMLSPDHFMCTGTEDILDQCTFSEETYFGYQMRSISTVELGVQCHGGTPIQPTNRTVIPEDENDHLTCIEANCHNEDCDFNNKTCNTSTDTFCYRVAFASAESIVISMGCYEEDNTWNGHVLKIRLCRNHQCNTPDMSLFHINITTTSVTPTSTMGEAMPTTTIYPRPIPAEFDKTTTPEMVDVVEVTSYAPSLFTRPTGFVIIFGIILISFISF